MKKGSTVQFIAIRDLFDGYCCIQLS